MTVGGQPRFHAKPPPKLMLTRRLPLPPPQPVDLPELVMELTEAVKASQPPPGVWKPPKVIGLGHG